MVGSHHHLRIKSPGERQHASGLENKPTYISSGGIVSIIEVGKGRYVAALEHR
jgi:hypothetical protein